MASSMVHSKKSFKRLESRKSHSWWWDSHASPKNSKWLAENLESMDQGVKRMLKLIEEDGDSFAKKAEMYYQKRPLLVSHVEEFYRMYRALAERYDHVTGELRKNMPSDLQSQGSSISDFGSEPSPEPKPSRRKSDSRAAGFEFFLGTVGSSSDLGNKEDDSSTLDSESESDDSSVNHYGKVAPEINGEEQIALRRKINELEVELRDVKEKVHTQEQEDSSIDSSKGATFENSEDLLARITEFEDETRDAKEKIKLADEEIAKLKNELQKYQSHDVRNSLEVELPLDRHKDANILADTLDLEKKDTEDLGERSDGFRGEVIDPERNMQILEEELVATKEKLHVSEREIAYLRQELENSRSSIDHLQEQLKQTKKETSSWKSKFDKEQREVSKLHDRINRYKNNLSEREQEIRRIRETISNANQVLSEENTLLKSEISNLSKEQNYLQDNLKEWELRCQSLEDEIKRIKAAKTEAEDMLLAEIEQLKEEYKLELDNIMMEKDELDAKTALLVGEVSSRDAQIEHLDCHLKQLHIEHVELISASETAQRQLKELKSEVEQLEEEVEKQREAIALGAEEKREAIRQLCFSLEHYRTGYHGLRKAFVGQKRLPVMAV